MTDMRNPDAFLDPITRVVTALRDVAPQLSPDRVMVVGACCRDILHHQLGHTFATTLTRDMDLALALSSWDAYKAVAAAFKPVGETGIRFRIADVDVDLLPFGEIEDPQGIVKPPTRGETMSAWAFEEIFGNTVGLPSPQVAIRLPTVAGYAAAKLGAWLDRSEWLEARDAADLALVLYWYSEDPRVSARLYDTDAGHEVLIAEDMDVPLAASHLLGVDIRAVLGPARLSELLGRLPGDAELLVRELVVRGLETWPRDQQRRRSLLEALGRGLRDGSSTEGTSGQPGTSA